MVNECLIDSFIYLSLLNTDLPESLIGKLQKRTNYLELKLGVH